MTRLSLPVPTESTANDVPLHLQAIVNALDPIVAKDARGTYAARPAAGNRGSWYYATDNTINGGLFYDNGTAWLRVTASPWVVWTPTVRVTDGGGNISSAVTCTTTSAVYQYRLMPNSEVEVSLEANVALQGAYVFCGLLFSSPLASSKAWELSGEAMNDLARCRVEDGGGALGNNISVFPHTGHNTSSWQFDSSGVYVGRWIVDNFGRLVRINGTYPV